MFQSFCKILIIVIGFFGVRFFHLGKFNCYWVILSAAFREWAMRKPHELPLNSQGQAETDETLRVKGHPCIFALGDSAALRDSNGRLLPATAQVLK